MKNNLEYVNKDKRLLLSLKTKLNNSNYWCIITKNQLTEKWFFGKDITLLIENKLINRLKNWVYFYDKSWNWIEVLKRNAYIIPFKENKDVYITWLSALKLWWSFSSITFWTRSRIKKYAIDIDSNTIDFDISEKNFIPKTESLTIDNTLINKATTEQAILDYLDTKNQSNDFEEFLQKIDEIKTTINYKDIINLAKNNWQFESLARIWYILDRILWYSFSEKDEFLELIKNNLGKNGVILNYSGKQNKWTSSSEWRMVNNMATSEKIINRREFIGLPIQYINKSNAIKLSTDLIKVKDKVGKIWFTFNDIELKDLLRYESYFWNLVEWTVFTLEEALNILIKDIEPKQRPKEDVYDIKNYFNIYEDFLLWKIDLNMPILDLIRLVNKRIAWHKWTEETWKPAGIFRCDTDIPYDVRVWTGFTPISHKWLKSLLNFIESEYNKITDPFIKSFFIHFFIAEAHPFADWNWRTARLVSNLILLKDWFLPHLCTPQNKNYVYSKGLSDMTDLSNPWKLIEYYEKAMKKSKEIFLEKNRAIKLFLLSKEFEEDSREVPRSSVDISDIITKFYKD